jgi:hypothetical protein
MNKIFIVLALLGVVTSCKDKSKDEKATTPATTTAPAPTTNEASPAPTGTTTPANTAPASETVAPPSAKKGAAIEGVPTFADPEVQKFANEYTVFIKNTYKAGIADPAKTAAIAKAANEWSAKMGTIGMKLSNNPEEIKKWEQWAKWISREMNAAGVSKSGS